MSGKNKDKKRGKRSTNDVYTKRQETLKKYVVSHQQFKRENVVLLRKLKYVVEAMKKFNTRRAKSSKEQTVTIKYGSNSSKKLVLTRETANKLFLHILHQLHENEKYFKNTMYAAMKKWISVEGDIATVEFVEKVNKNGDKVKNKNGDVVMVPVKMGSNKGKSLVMLSAVGVAWFRMMYDWLSENGESRLDSEKLTADDKNSENSEQIQKDLEKAKEQRVEAVKKIIATLEGIKEKSSRHVLTSAFVSNASAFFLNTFSEKAPESTDRDDQEVINEHKQSGKNNAQKRSPVGAHKPPAIMRYFMRDEWYNAVIDNLKHNSDKDEFTERVQGKSGNHYVFSSSFHLPPILRKRNSVKNSQKDSDAKKAAKETQDALKSYRAKGEHAKEGREIIRKTTHAVEIIKRHKNLIGKIRRERS